MVDLPEMAPEGGAPQSTAADRPQRVWTAFLAFVLAVVGMFVTSIIIVVVSLFAASPGAPDVSSSAFKQAVANPVVLIASVAATSSLLGATALMAAWLSPAGVRDRLSLRRPRVSPMAWAALLLGAPVLGQACESLVLALGFEPSGAVERLNEVMRNASGLQIPLLLLTFGLGPGIGEELLFRGYIQTRLIRRWGPPVGIGISSVLFGVMHMEAMHGFLAGVMGVYLGFVAYRCGSIVPAIAAHAFNNMSATALALLLGSDSDAFSHHATVGVVSTLIGIGCVALFIRGSAPRS